MLPARENQEVGFTQSLRDKFALLSTLQSGKSEKGLVECFINVAGAVGPICSCHTAQSINGQQGELKENILQNLFNNLTPQTVL